MAKQEERQEKGYGKYTLTEKIREKFPEIFIDPFGQSLPMVSTAILLEGIHFSLVYFPLKHLGYKAVLSSIAGIYSRGGKPESIMVSLGIGSRYGMEDIESLIEGVEIACRNYDLKVSDLNLDSSLTGLTLAITASGSADSRLMTPGVVPTETDLVVVTGDLGAAFMGLQLLERERKIYEETGGAQPALEGFEYVIGRQLKPEIWTEAFEKIHKAGIKPTSVRIIREGIASDLIGLARSSKLGCRLYHDKIPYTEECSAAGKEFGIEPLIAALSGGDDFEIMFTFPVTDFEKIKSLEGFSLAGHLTPAGEGNTLALQDGSLAELKAQGWEE